MDLRYKQKCAIQQLLNLNSADSVKTDQPSGVWKVLVYDEHCQNILLPLVNKPELRKLGITLYMLITDRRERVPDVPAIYFVYPSAENIKRISDDLSQGLYDSYHFNFCSSVPRDLLEQLAQECIKSRSVNKVSKVFDQYVDFMCLESALFSLNHKNSFSRLHAPGNDAEIESYIPVLVDSLFSVLATLEVLPIIRAAPGGAAQLVAEELNKRLFNHLRSGKQNLFAAARTSQRPVLILVDRTVDVATALHHGWTYQVLLHDLLKLNKNRVSIPGDNGKQTTYNLDTMTDSFYKANAANPFPKVADAVDKNVKEYKREADEIEKKTGSQGLELGVTAEGDLGGRMLGMEQAINALPELRKKKENVDKHTDIATCLLRLIKSREIDAYYSLEEDSILQGVANQEEMIKKLGVEGKGSPRDKLRMLMVAYMCCKDVDLDEMLKALNWDQLSAGSSTSNDISALSYLKEQKKYLNMGMETNRAEMQNNSRGEATSALFDTLKGGMNNALRSMALTNNTDLTLTKIVDDLMNNRDTKLINGYLHFDPKMKKGPIYSGQSAAAFDQAFVFVIGGGNYAEHHNLQDLVARKNKGMVKTSITYGATEILSPEQFLEQLSSCASQATRQVPVD